MGAKRFVFTGAVALGVVVSVFNIGDRVASAKPSVSLDQCATIPTTCGSTNSSQWQHGNLGSSNSYYKEGESIPYRATFAGLTVGATYAITIEWDSTQSGKHAIDTLTSFNRTITSADHCSGVACAGSSNTLHVPADPNISAVGVGQTIGQAISIVGGNFPASGSTVHNTGSLCPGSECTIGSNPSAYSMVGTYLGNSQTSIRIWLTADSSTVVLAWGGHIASRLDWGAEHSAAAISGSPFHMRLMGFDCSTVNNCGVGNMDRSISSDAVIYPAAITVIEDATPNLGTAFGYEATPTPLSSFVLIDDGTSANRKTFADITNFTNYTVIGGTAPSWVFRGASCAVASAYGGSQIVTDAVATIDLREGELVTCTYLHNTAFPPSISLTKSADVTTYSEVNDVITYTYTITNSGPIDIGPAQFTVTDDRIGGGTTFNCGSATSTLTVGASLSCVATYTISQSDIDADLVVNVAVAHVDDVDSSPATASVIYVPPVATTTTSSSTTSTSTSTTSTTTSTIPESTTTLVIEATTTTVDPTTTTVDPTTTTVDPTTTTVSPTSTIRTEDSSTSTAVETTTSTDPTTSSTTSAVITHLADTGNRSDLAMAVLLILLSAGFAIATLHRRNDI